MIIPPSKLTKFAKELIDQCNISRVDRTNQYEMMANYALCGGEDTQSSALYNKTYAYIDDLQSLLYSPVSLRYHIGDPDTPNVLEEAKGRAAAAKLRGVARKCDADTLISEAVWWSLIKGKGLIKSGFTRGEFTASLVQPENLGVRHENYRCLDENMEAFCHTTFISMEQFARMIWDRSDRNELMRKAQNYVVPASSSPEDTKRQVVTGGLYPFQPAGSGSPNNSRGFVFWMGAPKPSLDPQVHAHLLELNELWVWNDEADDWATFQMIGDDMLIFGHDYIANIFALDKDTRQSSPHLKGHHPFNEFCINPIDNYFWGRSEILNVALLQEALNARINGVNTIIRYVEDPSIKFSGVAGVNQNALLRYRKPGGYFSDTNPNAKVETDKREFPAELLAWIHEIERMFDEMGGLPPTARGHGEAGVRSHAHAETLVRMFSPRFKDRALLAERAVEALGGLHLDMAKDNIDKKLLAWVPQDAAGGQAMDPSELIPPPAKGFVAVPFAFSDLSDDSTLTVDSHSASPAFSEEAKALIFNLFKIGAMSAEDVVERSEVTDPEQLIAGITRRAIAKQEAAKEAEMVKLASHQKK